MVVTARTNDVPSGPSESRKVADVADRWMMDDGRGKGGRD